jgi:hypothetical protein
VKVIAEVAIQVVGMAARTKHWWRDWEAKAVLVLDRQEGAVERSKGYEALQCCHMWMTWGKRLDKEGKAGQCSQMLARWVEKAVDGDNVQ